MLKSEKMNIVMLLIFFIKKPILSIKRIGFLIQTIVWQPRYPAKCLGPVVLRPILSNSLPFSNETNRLYYEFLMLINTCNSTTTENSQSKLISTIPTIL